MKEMKHIDALVREIEEDPKNALENLKRLFAEFPKRDVLLRFEGIFIQPDIDGVPVISNIHRIDHQIIGLKDRERKETGFYLCDTHEYCKAPGTFYCAREDSVITLNRFDEKINPEKLRVFGNRTRRIDEVAEIVGSVGRGGYKITPWVDTGILKLQAFEEGGTRYLEERKEEPSVWVCGRLLKDHGRKYSEIRDFIEELRQIYEE
ncbi:hypothetical protein CMI37_11470 [Candidatus Pacearchaeota archaeon]|nr:hypothetical protein [Candidatus Pacearchaeota archaeon]|tara:strand:- start:6881 stop:7498 length:618 start_codon:yes stop_codon:yes gene_type:complete